MKSGSHSNTPASQDQQKISAGKIPVSAIYKEGQQEFGEDKDRRKRHRQ
jgi:hypothetical protein